MGGVVVMGCPVVGRVSRRTGPAGKEQVDHGEEAGGSRPGVPWPGPWSAWGRKFGWPHRAAPREPVWSQPGEVSHMTAATEHTTSRRPG